MNLKEMKCSNCAFYNNEYEECTYQSVTWGGASVKLSPDYCCFSLYQKALPDQQEDEA